MLDVGGHSNSRPGRSVRELNRLRAIFGENPTKIFASHSHHGVRHVLSRRPPQKLHNNDSSITNQGTNLESTHSAIFSKMSLPMLQVLIETNGLRTERISSPQSLPHMKAEGVNCPALNGASGLVVTSSNFGNLRSVRALKLMSPEVAIS
ncbi:hypothetical protein RRG08_013721 [Elysia crispata]|uniref:Uncharacterized protein n=1 Tax=Elysia crispata TaxID=231223 RepID=A0AAE0ZA25_9GAST|nr:hypothetical protein RRG08_013721 [Elysia crispata]